MRKVRFDESEAAKTIKVINPSYPPFHIRKPRQYVIKGGFFGIPFGDLSERCPPRLKTPSEKIKDQIYELVTKVTYPQLDWRSPFKFEHIFNWHQQEFESGNNIKSILELQQSFRNLFLKVVKGIFEEFAERFAAEKLFCMNNTTDSYTEGRQDDKEQPDEPHSKVVEKFEAAQPEIVSLLEELRVIHLEEYSEIEEYSESQQLNPRG